MGEIVLLVVICFFLLVLCMDSHVSPYENKPFPPAHPYAMDCYGFMCDRNSPYCESYRMGDKWFVRRDLRDKFELAPPLPRFYAGGEYNGKKIVQAWKNQEDRMWHLTLYEWSDNDKYIQIPFAIDEH